MHITEAVPQLSAAAKSFTRLQPSELIELHAQYKETGDLKIRDLIFESLFPMVFKIAHQFRSAHIGIEEIVSHGTVLLLEAIEKYEPRFPNITQYMMYALYNGTLNHLGNFDVVTMNHAMKSNIKNGEKAFSNLSLNAELFDEEDSYNYRCFLKYGMHGPEYFEEHQEMDFEYDAPIADQADEHWINRKIKCLPELHRNIIEMYYFQGIPRREICARLGLGVGTYDLRIREAKKILSDGNYKVRYYKKK